MFRSPTTISSTAAAVYENRANIHTHSRRLFTKQLATYLLSTTELNSGFEWNSALHCGKDNWKVLKRSACAYVWWTQAGEWNDRRYCVWCFFRIVSEIMLCACGTPLYVRLAWVPLAAINSTVCLRLVMQLRAGAYLLVCICTKLRRAVLVHILMFAFVILLFCSVRRFSLFPIWQPLIQ